MRFRATLRWAAITTFVLAAAGPATAQQGAPAASGSADAPVGFSQKAQLSIADELTQADAGLSRMDQVSGTVRRQLESARQSRDAVKTLCLNDKLSQIDVATRSARDRETALQAAAQRNDAELANHEFTIMTVLRQRAEQLSSEANQCIGEEVAFVGQTQITEEISPNLPQTDVTDFPSTDGLGIFVAPPPPTSPNQ
jgi:F0F1-type ATP synthase membrane subunit b/b'